MMDERGLGQLVDRHAAALILYARQWCAAPEDVVQEAFLKLVTQSRPPAAPVPWLYRVVRTRAISAARSAQRRRQHEAEAARRVEAWFVPETEHALDAAALAEALTALPAEPREVITLHLWGGLTFAEISDVLGCSPSSAHRSYQAALAQLRERIDSCPKTATNSKQP
jgi:RNA polymerase sigma-70 factor (ECF subfamily)